MPADPSRISDPAVRALARELGQVRRELDLVKAGQRASQLGNSSIEDGTLWFNDAAGIQRVGIGAQIDGKFGWFAVNGEAPPRPNTPELLPSVNGVTISWNGEFSGPAPSDFVHVKAYLSPVGQSFIPTEGNLVGHLLGASPLPVTPLEPNTDYWAVLIAYNTSGVASDPSFVAGPVRPTAVVATEILDGIVTDLKLADGAVSRAKIAVGAVGTAQIGNQQVDLSKLANGSVDATKIVDGSITPAKVTFTAQDIGSVATYNQPSQPSGTVPQGSLWFDGLKLRRYAGSSWFELTDAGIANALSAAQQAQTDAANALNTASGAQAAVAGKVTVYYQGSSPSGANTGDLWLNTSAGNALQRWTGSAWAPVSDTRIATALANAQTAQATADGKITAFYQGTAPSSGVGVGDLWYNTSAGNAVSRWNGTTWVALPAGSGALADGAVTTNKLANGSVTPAKVTFTAADIGSIVTYSQVSAPTGPIATGSLWLDGNNKLFRWNGTTWVAASDSDIASALSAAQNAQTNAAQALTQAAGAQAAVDGKVTVYYQTWAPGGTFTAFPNSTYSVGSVRTDGPYTLGHEFVVTSGGKATGVRYYRATTAIGSGQIGLLYRVTGASTGVELARVSFASPVGTGWQSASFSAPVDLVVGQRYRVAVLYPSGFAQTTPFWSGGGAGASGVTQGPLQMLPRADATGTAQASYVSGASPAFPYIDSNGANWWIDVTVAAAAPSLGDLWIDLSSGNKLSRWSGNAWVLVDDQRIATALANAATAQSTADGKIDAFYQNDAPTSGMSVGDLWYDLDGGNLAYRWNGAAWVSLPVGAAAITDGSIISSKLASGAVTLGKLADGSVPGAAVVTDAITADKIATGAVGSSELTAGAVIAGKVAAGAIGTNELAANSVVAGKVAANTIGANEIIANSVVAGKLAADSVTSTNIVAGGVQTANLAADSVAAGKIAAEAVTAREIKALTITGDRIAANTIDAGQIKAGAVTADKLAAILVLASQIIAGDPNDWHLELGDSQTPILYWNNTETGFAVSRDQTTGQANVYMSGRVEFGNGSQIESDYLDLCEQVATGYQMPSLRQSRTLIYSEPVSTPSPAPSWLSATGKGNLLYLSVLAANLAGSGAPTITVPAGWSVVRTVTGGATGSTRMTTYQIPGVSHTSSHTSEAISANVPCAWSIGMIEASGIQLSSPLDVVQSQTGSGGTASTGTTGTPTQGNEFQIAVFGTPGAGTPGKSGFSAPTNGFSLVSQGGGYNGQGSAVLTKIVTGALPASTQATVTPPNPWLGIIATFRTAPAAPVPEPPPARTVRLFTQSRGGASTPFVVDSASNVYPVGRVPYCKVRLTGDVFLAANTDVYAQSAWTPAGDPWGMVAISSSAGTFSNITIPFTGLYFIDLKVIYQQSTNTTSTVAAFVTKNGRDAANNSIARDARKYIQDGGDGTPVQAIRQLVLSAGDVLYWGTFSSVNTNFYSGRLNIPTEITVAYMGVGG